MTSPRISSPTTSYCWLITSVNKDALSETQVSEGFVFQGMNDEACTGCLLVSDNLSQILCISALTWSMQDSLNCANGILSINGVCIICMMGLSCLIADRTFWVEPPWMTLSTKDKIILFSLSKFCNPITYCLCSVSREERLASLAWFLETSEARSRILPKCISTWANVRGPAVWALSVAVLNWAAWCLSPCAVERRRTHPTAAGTLLGAVLETSGVIELRDIRVLTIEVSALADFNAMERAVFVV